jgi:hypothetical protein
LNGNYTNGDASLLWCQCHEDNICIDRKNMNVVCNAAKEQYFNLLVMKLYIMSIKKPFPYITVSSVCLEVPLLLLSVETGLPPVTILLSKLMIQVIKSYAIND